jgi:glycosyltransferase involved in cell wall biosynthesis
VVLAPFQRRITIAGEGDIANWTSPLKVFEYMAAGKAILCSDLPVLREVMRDGDNCLLLPPDDVDAWSAALERLRDDGDLRARLGKNARLDFLEHYTWKARASRVLDTLR